MNMLLKAVSAIIFLALICQKSAFALPLGSIKLVYFANEDGSYTYVFSVKNEGPLTSPKVTTPPDHIIKDWETGNSYPAGGKALADDKNLVLFGLDTRKDNVVISDIRNGFSAFKGSEEKGFADNDGDGKPNQVIAWHLPAGFTLGQTLRPGQTIRLLSFTLNKEIKQFPYWVGGSDDTTIWNDNSVMLEDEYGHYDATQGKYLGTFITRSIKARKIEGRSLKKLLDIIYK